MTLWSHEAVYKLMMEHNKGQNVLVHCAAGMQRSASIVGMYLIATSKDTNNKQQESIEDTHKHNYGVIMGIIAAITETLIFVFIRSNKDAQASPYYTVNHLYPAGLVILLIFGALNKNMIDTNNISWMKLIGFNALLGFTGYLSRFYAIPKISTLVFSMLSFFGVAFGYTWGILFTGDKPTMKAIIGGGLIAGSAGLLRYFS
jgi:drug/metabolite transporter (DMT)-like permease